MPGLPVRLIRRDQKQIKLDCTDFDVTVKRNVTATAVPLTGERLSFDLNMVESVIRLQCLLSDDDCLDTDFVAGQAQGFVDFSSRLQLGMSLDAMDLVRFMQGDEGLHTLANLNGTVISIYAVPNSGSVAVVINITLSSTETSHTHTSSVTDGVTTHELTVGLDQDTDSGITQASTGAFMAQIIKEAITDQSALSALITPTVTSGMLDADDENSRLRVVMVNRGSVAAYSEMTFEPEGDVELPYIEPIIDVDTNSCFSAGDKVQNLMGVTVNNSILGFAGGLISDNIMGMDWSALDSVNEGYDDYIVGLQIPYNSFQGIQSIYGETAETTPQSYSARNFYYGTGFANRRKNAASNTLVASTPFDIKNRNTGIRGTVIAIDINYQAGDTVYGVTITFQPIDLLTGI